MVDQSKSNSGGANNNAKALYLRYPVNSSWEFTLPNDEVVAGMVYCTDEVSQSIVLQKPNVHSTLTFEIRIVQANAIKKASLVSSAEENKSKKSIPVSKPLPVIQKKALEEREKRAIRMAEESFRHINQNASSLGQAVFDRLLKACNEVVWKGDTILVLNNIQVDPPYTQDDCKIVQKSGSTGLQDGSLERVKKIVTATTVSGNH